MQPISRKVISFLFIIFTILSLFGDDKTLLQTIVKKYKNSNTFSCKIKQENYYKAQNKKLISIGEFCKQDNLYMLIFNKPHHQFIKFTNSEVIVYDSSVKSAHIITIKDFPSFNPQLLFSEIDKGNFSIEKDSKNYIVNLPLFSEFINSLTFSLDTEKLLIQSINYNDQLKNSVLINFSDHQFNKQLTYNLNTYTYPKNTKILKQ